MPVERQQPGATDRTPRIRRRRGKAKRKSARQNLKVPVVMPACSRKVLPPPGPCPKAACKGEDCTVHCKEPAVTKGPGAYRHVVDVRWLGWAKGYRDGTFDVSCVNCGEIGWVRCVPESEDVVWD